jgi:hypothetical protein
LGACADLPAPSFLPAMPRRLERHARAVVLRMI